MKIAYTDKLGLGKANIARLEVVNGIIDEYVEMGYVMTLRQLYYQLVSRNVIANNVAEYGKLSKLLTKGRMAGIVDWAAIIDRGRQEKIPYFVTGIQDALNDTAQQYRLDRMEGQDYKVEVWVEKDALSNIFYRVTKEYHISLMVNKGYSSCSAMHDAFQRLENDGRPVVVLYFGDHDPSGKDMVRDIKNRFEEFGLSDFEIYNPALSMQQIRQYNLPRNPAKITDPRAKAYIDKYGEYSWELDALEPPVLEAIIRLSAKKWIDEDVYKEMLVREAKEKEEILKIAKNYK